MAYKKLITGALGVFVIVTLVMAAITISRDMNSANDTQQAHVGTNTQAEFDDTDVVYYFMTSQRCQNCMNIESFTREAVEQTYSKKLADKSLTWKMVNVDQPENRHFIQDYQLVTKSVVLVQYRNGVPMKWKNLDAVWTLLGDKTAFQNYIIHEVNSFAGQG